MRLSSGAVFILALVAFGAFLYYENPFSLSSAPTCQASPIGGSSNTVTISGTVQILSKASAAPTSATFTPQTCYAAQSYKATITTNTYSLSILPGSYWVSVSYTYWSGSAYSSGTCAPPPVTISTAPLQTVNLQC